MIPVHCSCGTAFHPIAGSFADATMADMRRHWDWGHSPRFKATLVEVVVFKQHLGKQLQNWSDRGCPSYNPSYF
jgi:hypothetical protein